MPATQPCSSRGAAGQDTRTRFPHPKAGIAAIHLLRDELDSLEADLLDVARELGISWEKIAPAVKVKDRRAAQKRAHRLWERYPRLRDRWHECRGGQ